MKAIDYPYILLDRFQTILRAKAGKDNNMEVSVDRDLCIGCGLCVSICPQVFEMDDERKAIIHTKPAEITGALQEAVDGCPTSAISIG